MRQPVSSWRVGRAIGASNRGCCAGQRTYVLPCCFGNRVAAGKRDHRERLKRNGMVDLLGMFRRRPARRNPPGFARSRENITALGDSMGDMLTSPVRDAPPLAREAPPMDRD